MRTARTAIIASQPRLTSPFPSAAGELAIRNTVSTCDCLEVSLDQTKLQPGQGTHLKLKIHTRTRRGRVIEKIGIRSNDPSGPKTLTVGFEVQEDLAAVPDRLYMGFAKPGQAVRKYVRIVAHADVQTKVLYAISSTNGLVGRVIETAVSKGRPAKLEVEFTAPSQPGTYRGSLTITTAHAGKPNIHLPVVLCVTRAVTVTPDRLDFGRFAHGNTPSTTIMVKTAPGTKLQAVTTKSKLVDVELGPADTEGAVPVKVSARKDTPPGPFSGELQLRLAGQEEAALPVPFEGQVVCR
ncbi:MAG TPA: DUF1573 domain-containing protein [Phycisphaerae bacterium]|nr:DUF1573 domain-containing protein [Phycisphaerae bacterium]